MNVSLNWVQEFTDLSGVSADEILQRIGAQLGAVEEVVNIGARYDNIVVAKIVSCQKHPDADKLSVCLVDDAGVTPNVDRNADGLVQVVCGAPNVREGLLVAWLPPGSTVPSTIGKDPFVLGTRELRGVVSNGMLASSSELGISDDHEGILEITEDDKEKPGQAFKELYGLDDVVIDCENKMFTHRPDCFGILGVGRELAGITGKAFVSPKWYCDTAKHLGTGFKSNNTVPEKVPRFTVQVINNVTVRPSPMFIQTALMRVGSRPINNIVDLTNYYMHLTAQPTHAFDYEKVKALCSGEVTIFPRMAEDGEELELLNGKTIKLTAQDIVIATDKQAIALGGVMGGAATEVDDNTKNIIVECANFDMYTIRRTSMRHGLFTEAVTRFNKGQSDLQNDVVLNQLSKDIIAFADATLGVAYDSHPEKMADHWPAILVSVDFVNARLGSKLKAEDMKTLLQNVEFDVDIEDGNVVVSAPFWRKDIEIPEDIVEEIGRLYGFDKLPVTLPLRPIRAAPKNLTIELEQQIRSNLASAGANEILTYSFVSDKVLQYAEQDISQAYQLSNALSPELQYYRLTLTPSVLSKVQQNIRAGYDRFVLFEINKAHVKSYGLTDEGVPQEVDSLSLVYAANPKTVDPSEGAPYFKAKKYLDHLSICLGLQLDYEPLTSEPAYEVTKPFNWKRSAMVKDRATGTLIGVVGEFTPNIRRNLKLPSYIAGFEISINALKDIANKSNSYQPLSRFPHITQDITFKTAVDQQFVDILEHLEHQLSQYGSENGFAVKVETLDIYHKEHSKNKHVTFRVDIHHPDRTLKTDEVTTYIDEVVTAVGKKIDAQRV